MAQSLPKLPDWEQVSTNIIRIMGGNPSKVRRPLPPPPLLVILPCTRA